MQCLVARIVHSGDKCRASSISRGVNRRGGGVSVEIPVALIKTLISQDSGAYLVLN